MFRKKISFAYQMSIHLTFRSVVKTAFKIIIKTIEIRIYFLGPVVLSAGGRMLGQTFPN